MLSRFTTTVLSPPVTFRSAAAMPDPRRYVAEVLPCDADIATPRSASSLSAIMRTAGGKCTGSGTGATASSSSPLSLGSPATTAGTDTTVKQHSRRGESFTVKHQGRRMKCHTLQARHCPDAAAQPTANRTYASVADRFPPRVDSGERTVHHGPHPRRLPLLTWADRHCVYGAWKRRPGVNQCALVHASWLSAPNAALLVLQLVWMGWFVHHQTRIQ